MFTSGQIIALYVFTLFIIWGIIAKGMDVIKHCSTQKTYRILKIREMQEIPELPKIIVNKEKKDD